MNLPMQTPVVAQSVADVSAMIRQHLTQQLKGDHPDFNEEVHDNMSFDYIGLDSFSRVNMLTELAKHFGVKLEPTAAYDFVTVGSLAEFIWSEISGTPMDMKKALGI
ncbi:acyl carrier protein [Cellvibrio sp. OA-2007]|uniref:acyl carrier protein n=1 Tax=Cellvibrio sp. OA-2007 TaxID=529823 RepID=UPI00078339D8|nr:acyl carrier protein [Cellvibrio sp. OA-2007]